MVRAAAAGVGNAVVLMGASTGRDGIGGASVLASAELGEGDEAKRPTVQIGDPFEESKVLECCLELLEKGLLVSLQDLGAAGLTSSAGEMASAGGVGIDIDVARVPLREADMEPFEIMVSESQERMLAVVEPAQVAEVLAVCEKWQTGVGGDRRRHRHRPGADPARRARSVGEMPVEALVDGCPLYDLEPAEPEGWIYGNRATLDAGRLAGGDAAGAARLPQHRLQALGLRAVRLGRRLAHGAPARVGRRRGPAAARGRQRDRRLDRRQRPPRRLRPLRRHDRGGARVRPEPRLRRRRAARPDQLPQLRQPGETGARLAARPRGQRPRRRLQGARRPRRRRQRLPLQRGARRPDLPDPGGRHGRRAARPGGGRRQRLRQARATRSPCSAPSRPPLPARSWRSCAASSTTGLPEPDIAAVAAACAVVRDAVRAGKLSSAHDISDGGLACALAESAIGAGSRLPVDLQPLRERGCSPEEALFGEGAGGFLLSGERARAGGARRDAHSARSAARDVEIAAGDRSLTVGLAAAESAWRSLPAQAERAAPEASAAKTAKR